MAWNTTGTGAFRFDSLSLRDPSSPMRTPTRDADSAEVATGKEYLRLGAVDRTKNDYRNNGRRASSSLVQHIRRICQTPFRRALASVASRTPRDADSGHRSNTLATILD